MKKDRGILLTLVIIILALGTIINIYYTINPDTIKQTPGLTNPIQTGPLEQLISIIGLIIGGASVIGLWMWKKWAAYLYGIGFIISIFTLAYTQKMALTDTGRQQFGLYAYLFPIIEGAFILWVIRRKWQYFD